MSSKRANPFLIGAFVVGGLALMALALAVVAGGELFERKQRAVMYFNGSLYGLAVGAPVVFRGVQVGSVRSIGIFYDRKADAFAIPVVADLESDAIRGLDGKRAGAEAALPALIEHGLTAQLSMQSLLTGQLYVDLDLRPQQQANRRGGEGGLTEIPTSTTVIQNLKNQLDGIDFRKMMDDLSSIATAARDTMGGEKLKQTLQDLQAIAGNVRRVTDRVDKQFDPLAASAGGAMASTQRAMDKLGSAADGIASTARSLDATARGLQTTLAPDSPLLRDVRSAADQLAQTAASLRRTTGDDSALVRNADRALQDVARAARAMRQLAETLDSHPDALLRGRPRLESAEPAPSTAR